MKSLVTLTVLMEDPYALTGISVTYFYQKVLEMLRTKECMTNEYMNANEKVCVKYYFIMGLY